MGRDVSVRDQRTASYSLAEANGCIIHTPPPERAALMHLSPSAPPPPTMITHVSASIVSPSTASTPSAPSSVPNRTAGGSPPPFAKGGSSFSANRIESAEESAQQTTSASGNLRAGRRPGRPLHANAEHVYSPVFAMCCGVHTWPPVA
eukprot:856499-Prorocentrum_minimum.AAC.1